MFSIMSVCLSVWSQGNSHQIRWFANEKPSSFSGGFRGGAGARPPPSKRPNSFNFMQFSGKFGKIVCWRPPPGQLAPPWRNPGSAAVFYFNVSGIIQTIWLHYLPVMLKFRIFAGQCQKPYSLSLCSVLVTTLIVYAVMTAMYSANLIAFLSVEKYQVPFETFLELSEQNSYRFGFIGGGSLVDFFKVLSYWSF